MPNLRLSGEVKILATFLQPNPWEKLWGHIDYKENNSIWMNWQQKLSKKEVQLNNMKTNWFCKIPDSSYGYTVIFPKLDVAEVRKLITSKKITFENKIAHR